MRRTRPPSSSEREHPADLSLKIQQSHFHRTEGLLQTRESGTALKHFPAQTGKVSGVEAHHRRTQVAIDQLSHVGRGGPGPETHMPLAGAGPDQQAIAFVDRDLASVNRPPQRLGQRRGQQTGLQLIDFHFQGGSA